MSSPRPSQQTGSTHTQTQDEPMPFLIAQYEGRKLTVPRSVNYQGTVASLKRNISSLRAIPEDRIFILALLPAVNDHVQITEEVWASLCPKLTTIRIEQDTRDQAQRSKREHSPDIWSDKKHSKSAQPRRLQARESTIRESSQASMGTTEASRDKSYNDSSRGGQHRSPWNGTNIGPMRYHKRRTKHGLNLQPLTWSYSRDGIDRVSVGHRAVGDVHASPTDPEDDKFDHWVCRIIGGRKKWSRVSRGDPHPTQGGYVLRDGTMMLPPQWVLPVSLRCAEYRLNLGSKR
ncbi:unnamed protein product [Rhizoctonia solani]|uniref:Uncharacterized protein n=1 Tax=Rhizoctonia solani TaxID=456999 RepID=A0A8H3GTQ2_9AGAM|nr:unnamed protein product [Rhizoctonia solani]